MISLREFIKQRPYLLWYSKNYDNLSKASVVESVLNYGNWDDYLYLENLLGITELNSVFKELKNKKRVNLRPQVINYFSNYFNAYA